jgi:uncharacterized protein (DUF433 family)
MLSKFARGTEGLHAAPLAVPYADRAVLQVNGRQTPIPDGIVSTVRMARAQVAFFPLTFPFNLAVLRRMKTGAPLSVPPEVPIWVDPERMSGAPCFKGTRVPVESLFTNLESGLSLDGYLDCFPDVTREQAVAVLEYAHKLALQTAA